jgi:hypothetical protein
MRSRRALFVLPGTRPINSPLLTKRFASFSRRHLATTLGSAPGTASNSSGCSKNTTSVVGFNTNPTHRGYATRTSATT